MIKTLLIAVLFSLLAACQQVTTPQGPALTTLVDPAYLSAPHLVDTVIAFQVTGRTVTFTSTNGIPAFLELFWRDEKGAAFDVEIVTMQPGESIHRKVPEGFRLETFRRTQLDRRVGYPIRWFY